MSPQTPLVPLVARAAPLLHIDGLTFKDLNKNGVLDPYEDWRRPVAERVADLIARLTVEEKVGLMHYASNHGAYIGPEGELLDEPAQPLPDAGRPFEPRFVGHLPQPAMLSPQQMVLERHMRYVNNFGGWPPVIEARWNNALQELAEGSRLGIPIVFGTDPRNGNPRAGFAPWPPQLGQAATRDAGLVRELARLANEQQRAIGVRYHIAPMADVATEPRWPRIPGTFGEDGPLCATLVRAYIEGMQAGTGVNTESVLCSVKHFPGDGPVVDGTDPHNYYGRFAAYPGGQFEYHLQPFRAAFEAGAAAVMTCYAIPLGIDTVGAGFSAKLIQGLLRSELGYDGQVVTDWGITRTMPWGVEDQPLAERVRLIVASGHDHLGGETDSEVLLSLVQTGVVTEERLDESMRRILTPMYQMGLFENPYVDAERAGEVVGGPRATAAGRAATRRSFTLLKNAQNLLPLGPGRKVYAENLSPEAVATLGTPVDTPEQADVAIIAVEAPYQLVGQPTFFVPIGPAAGEGGAGGRRPGGGPLRHEGTLAYADAANAEELAAIQRLAATGVPVVVVIELDRPAVLSEFIDQVAAVLAHYGADDLAVADVLAGRARPEGKLPFNLPRSMAAVLARRTDVAHDDPDPLFPFGFGLSYR
ncbi:MAG: glycoside hydrolase family 3 N-terminal domain-containing protein [Anaerolineales bacterium]